ncbi:MAG: hypothetical protein F9K48_01910 [Candidatus Brocadia sp.]|nr:MAG: hypothetical protein F9K48_01910 [Candidatus Brocadia sp.]
MKTIRPTFRPFFSTVKLGTLLYIVRYSETWFPIKASIGEEALTYYLVIFILMSILICLFCLIQWGIYSLSYGKDFLKIRRFLSTVKISRSAITSVENGNSLGTKIIGTTKIEINVAGSKSYSIPCVKFEDASEFDVWHTQESVTRSITDDKVAKVS